MDYAYSILMGIFALALWAYAAVLALTGDYKMLPQRAQNSVKPKDPKKYARALARILALTALAPALSALVGIWNMWGALAILILGLVITLWAGTKMMDKAE
ncbi:MAG: hypothetical protein II794_07840 [Oscillospiraceae bacterium]|nr:hypothetical protein [Oscillospiraceae bacterium]